MDLPASRRISVPDGTQAHCREPTRFRLRGYHPLWTGLSRPLRLTGWFVTPWRIGSSSWQGLQPLHNIGLPATKLCRFGLFPVRSPLLRECSLFLRVLRCFSSPGSLHLAYGFSQGCHGFAMAGFPIRKSPDQRLHTPPRGLSQCAASFIGSWRLGIHRKPLVACP